jgi:predicted transcriptional regulator of viral defense system
MKYLDFYNTFRKRALIDVREVRSVFPDFESRRFYEWQKKGYLKKLSKLFYIFTDKTIGDGERYFIANRLVEPSYISNEAALRAYNLIPEMVFLTTCITTRKTRTIETVIGNFQYQSIKENLFFGYKLIDINGLIYKIAEPEKALLDFLYLRSDLRNRNDLIELRLNEEIYRTLINQEKLQQYLAVFNSTVLKRKINKLNKILKICSV